MARAVQPRQKRPFGGELLAGREVVDRGQHGLGAGIVAAAFHPDRALRHGGQHLGHGNRARHLRHAKPVQPRHRQKRRLRHAKMCIRDRVYPYQSLIAIDRIGLSKPVFSLVLVLASLTAVTTAVLFGIWGDQRGSRRNIALTAALAGTLGLGLMIAAPGPLVLILSIGVLLPVASSLYGQLFALARLASAEDGRTRDGILGTIRAAMSASFLAMLIYWTCLLYTSRCV